MPLSKHFSGHGEAIMAAMKKRYGHKAERIFYATEQKHKVKKKPRKKVHRKMEHGD